MDYNFVEDSAVNELGAKTKELGYAKPEDIVPTATLEELEAICQDIFSRPEKAFEGYHDATATVLPEDVEEDILCHRITSFKNAFEGCAAITSFRVMDTSYATDMSGMFKNCSSLPEMAEWSINCAAIESVEGLRDIFAGSSVKKCRFENVKKELVNQMTSSNLGFQLQLIIVNGEVSV